MNNQVWLLGVIGAGLLIFLFLAVAVHGGEPDSMDTGVLLALRTPGDLGAPIGPHWLRGFIEGVTELASTLIVVVFTILLIVFFAMRRHWINIGVLLAAVIGEPVLVGQLKSLFGRARPDIVPHFIEASSFSFPSGHASTAAAFYLTVAALLMLEFRSARIIIISLAAAVIFLIGFSRIYLGVHYPSDVLAGWAIGAVWASIVLLAGRSLKDAGARKA